MLHRGRRPGGIVGAGSGVGGGAVGAIVGSGVGAAVATAQRQGASESCASTHSSAVKRPFCPSTSASPHVSVTLRNAVGSVTAPPLEQMLQNGMIGDPGAAVGIGVGSGVGASVGTFEGSGVGRGEGAAVGINSAGTVHSQRS
mmetsp:Transcript_37808/g.92003  ORF Transcript_37808/g.92003 Transcript_37808/m.92003 type:complete len:143 (+) Transcript_37808:2130-2558(+)